MVVATAVIAPSESRAWDKNHPETLLVALRSSFKEKDVIEIIASSGARILFNKKLLLLFSRTIRKCLADLPCCEAPTSITLVDINIGALKKVKEILENTLHDVTTEFSQEDIEEIVAAAKALGIEMTNVKVSSKTGKAKMKRKKSLSSEPLTPARYLSERTDDTEADVVQLEEEPVTENVEQVPSVQDMDYDEERPLEISVDISSSSDEEDEDEDTEQYEVEGTIFRSSQDTTLQETNDDTKLLRDDTYHTDEDESLQEESKPVSENYEKISFSFLSGIDSTNTSTEIPKKTLHEPKTEQTADATTVINDGSAIFKDHYLSGLSREAEPGPSGSSSEAAANTTTEFKLRCDLCGKPQKGPSALKEHYSITHFFEVKIVNIQFNHIL